MKNYVTLKCSVCTRQKDELVDLTHYTPDRCTITLACEGRLTVVGHTSEGSTLLSVPPAGLTNWYPRGSTVAVGTALATDALYDTSTGAYGQLVVAVSVAALGYDPGPASTMTIGLLAEQQVARDYRQYTYRRTGAVSVINGVEDATTKKVLRYTLVGPTPDQVEVYVNGVKRTAGVGADQYQLYDGTVGSPVPVNSVLFGAPVTGTSQIDVVVTKAVAPSALTLTFTRAVSDEARVGTGAWEGVGLVRSPAVGDRALFYCDFSEIAATLPLDVKLRLDPAAPPAVRDTPVSAPTTLPVSQLSLLLSRAKVHTTIDRLLAVWVPLAALGTEYLVTKLLDGTRALLVTERAVASLFPPLEAVRYAASTPLRRGIGADGAAELSNPSINGPDA